MSDEPVQLLVYRFGTDAVFHGQLSGALERMETGDALRVLDVVVVGLERTTGEVFAVALRGGGAGGLTAALLEFRLHAPRRGAGPPPPPAPPAAPWPLQASTRSSSRSWPRRSSRARRWSRCSWGMPGSGGSAARSSA